VRVPIARHGQRVDGVDLVAGADQGPDQQPSVDLDADNHLVVVHIGVLGHEGMELADALHAVDYATRAEHAALGVHHTDVVMVLSPIHTHIEHLPPLLMSPRRHRGDRMDQCSRHATPPAVFLLTGPAGHDLTLGLTVWGTAVLPNRWLGDQPASDKPIESH
jgi:hypothetical protein